MEDSENNVCILELGAIGLVLIPYLSASGSLILLAHLGRCKKLEGGKTMSVDGACSGWQKKREVREHKTFLKTIWTKAGRLQFLMVN